MAEESLLTTTPAASSAGTTTTPAPQMGAAPTQTTTTTQTTQSFSALPDNWYESLGDDLKNEASLRNFKDVPSLAKSLVHAQKALGADKVAIPGKFATEDDWRSFYQKVGMPSKPEDYKMNLSKDVQLDADLMKGYTDIAMKANILPKQAEAVVNWFNETAKKQADEQGKAQAQQRETEMTALKKEWGEGFDAKLNRAREALRTYADTDTLQYLAKTGLGNDVNLVRIFAKIGDGMKEHGIIGDNPGAPTGKTPEELQAEINSIYADKTHPYHVAGHPNHAEAVEAVRKLFERKMQGA